MFLTTLVGACALQFAAARVANTPPAAPAPEPVARLHIPAAAVARLTPAELAALDLDIVRFDRGTGGLTVLAGPDDRARLVSSGVDFEVVHADEQRFYADRLRADPQQAQGAPAYGAWLQPPFGQGSMGGYYTFGELVSVLDQLAAAYPDIVSPKQSIGTSLEGRELWTVQVTDQPGVDEGEPAVRIDTLHHAREPMGLHAALWYLLWALEGYGIDPLATHLIDDRELWFVPVVNPDGYVFNEVNFPDGGGLWRKNLRDNGDGTFGVDLNRNYPFQWGYDSLGSSGDTDSETYRGPMPASEPETQAMVAFIGQHQFRTALSIHTYSNLWLQPFGYDVAFPTNQADYQEIGELAVQENGYEVGIPAFVLDVANGITIDYDHSAADTMSWTPEIGSQVDGFWPPSSRIVPLAEENLLAIQRTARAAGAWVRVAQLTAVEIGNGDGYLQGGEAVELVLELRNSGRAAATPVSVQLTSESSFVTVSAGTWSTTELGSFASTTVPAGALRVELAPDTPFGTEIPYVLGVAYEGFAGTAEGRLVVGVPRPYLADAVEIDLGWTTGDPSDTASTGLWELADPIGTSSNGEPASPSDDASPSPGVLCYTTGNGGGSAGDDDVDDGVTTLISPRFDLSSAGGATLSYSRWFADLSTEDDVFDVSISNDDGLTWHALESVAGNQNTWTTVEFLVADVLPPTERMRLRFVASDEPNNSVVEAAIDELRVLAYDDAPRVHVYGDPEIGTPVSFQVSVPGGGAFTLYWSTGSASQGFPGIDGVLLLDLASFGTLFAGAVSIDGLSQTVATIPLNPGLVGQSLVLQALVGSASGPAFSNAALLTFE